MRKLKSLTQKEMAEKIGINPSAYSNYENNYSEPNFDILESITKFLGIPAQDILFTDMSTNDGELLPQKTTFGGKGHHFVKITPPTDLQKQVDNLRNEIETIKKQLKKKA